MKKELHLSFINSVMLGSLLLCLPLSQKAFAQLPAIEWQRCLGGSLEDTAVSGTQDADGNYLVASCVKSSDGDISSNHGGYDVWVTKLNEQGNTIWSTIIGGNDDEFATSVIFTSDGGVAITGQTESNGNGDIPFYITDPMFDHASIFIAKLDSEGSLQWLKVVTEGDVYGIAETSDAGFIICGRMIAGSGNVIHPNALVVKVDAQGDLEWEENYGGPGIDYAWSIVQASDGNYVFGGASATGNNNAFASVGGHDVWLAKLDPTGGVIWQKNFGSSQSDSTRGLMELSDGGFLVSAATLGNDGHVTQHFGGWDAWVLKLDTEGDLVWQKSYGGNFADELNRMYENADGHYIFGGTSNSQNAGDILGIQGGHDIWVFKVDKDNGDLFWEEYFGGTNNDRIGNFNQTLDGGFLVTGSTSSNDGDISGNHGGGDAWVAKLTPEVLSVDEMMPSRIVLFPNPASNVLHIQAADIQKIQIYDTLGKEIISMDMSHTIDISGLSSGIYYLKVEGLSGSSTLKWIKS